MLNFQPGPQYHHYHCGVFTCASEFRLPLAGDMVLDYGVFLHQAEKTNSLEEIQNRVSATHKNTAEVSLYHLSSTDTPQVLKFMTTLSDMFLSGAYAESCTGLYGEGVSYILALRHLTEGGSILVAVDVAGEYIYENSLLDKEINDFFVRSGITPIHSAFTEHSYNSSGPDMWETQKEENNDNILDFISLLLDDEEIRVSADNKNPYAGYEEVEYRDEEYGDYPSDYSQEEQY